MAVQLHDVLWNKGMMLFLFYSKIKLDLWNAEGLKWLSEWKFWMTRALLFSVLSVEGYKFLKWRLLEYWVHCFPQHQSGSVPTVLFASESDNLLEFKAFTVTQSRILHNPCGSSYTLPTIPYFNSFKLFYLHISFLFDPITVLIYFLRKKSTDTPGIHENKTFI